MMFEPIVLDLGGWIFLVATILRGHSSASGNDVEGRSVLGGDVGKRSGTNVIRARKRKQYVPRDPLNLGRQASSISPLQACPPQTSALHRAPLRQRHYISRLYRCYVNGQQIICTMPQICCGRCASAWLSDLKRDPRGLCSAEAPCTGRLRGTLVQPFVCPLPSLGAESGHRCGAVGQACPLLDGTRDHDDARWRHGWLRLGL